MNTDEDMMHGACGNTIPESEWMEHWQDCIDCRTEYTDF